MSRTMDEFVRDALIWATMPERTTAEIKDATRGFVKFVKSRQPGTSADLAEVRKAGLSLERAIRSARGEPEPVEKAKSEPFDVIAVVDKRTKELLPGRTTGEARRMAAEEVISQLHARYAAVNS